MTDPDLPPTMAELRSLAEQALTNGKPLPWPALPDLGAGELALRIYLTAAFGLVYGWHVGRVERHGPYGSDSVVIEVITMGGRRAIRFDQLDQIADPKVLRRTVSAQLAGVTLMRPIKAPEAFDVFTAVCRLANIVEHTTHVDDTLTYLRDYVDAGDRIHLPFDTSEHRYDSLGALKGRQAFQHPQASAFLRRDLAPESRWAVVVDSSAVRQAWVRKSEFLVYLRHVIGLPAAPPRTWDAKLYEAGGRLVRMAADRRTRTGGGKRHELRLYELPDVTISAILGT